VGKSMKILVVMFMSFLYISCAMGMNAKLLPFFMQHRSAVPLLLCQRQLASSQTIEGKIADLQRVFPIEVRVRFMKDFNIYYTDQTVAKLIKTQNEWIRYAFLVKYYQTAFGMFSKEVDNFWHTFLLFSKDYEDFCEHLPGNKPYLYHKPRYDTEICPTNCQWKEKVIFRRAYERLYGSSPDEEIWSAVLKPCKPSCINRNDDSSLSGNGGSDGSSCGGGGCGCD